VRFCMPSDSSCSSPTGILSSISWTATRELANWYSDAGYHEFKRDGAGRILEANLRFSGPTGSLRAQDTYAYANDGNVKTRNSFVGSHSTPHDSLSRVRGDESGAYAFDDAGNRTSSPLGAITYQSAANDRVASAYGSSWATDLSGNVTARGDVALEYDDDGSVTRISKGVSSTVYERDYRNLRLTRAGGGGGGTFLYDLDGRLVHFTSPTEYFGSCWRCITRKDGTQECFADQYRRIRYENYVHVAGIPLAMVGSKVESDCGGLTWGSLTVEATYQYIVEKMGVPRGVYKGGIAHWTATYDAWGTAKHFNADLDGDGVTFRHDFRLPGQFALGVNEGGPNGTTGGFHENWWRVYDSTTGRYLQPDPVGLHRAGAPTPLNQIYAYAESSPLRFTDPYGLLATEGCTPEQDRRIREAARNIVGRLWSCTECDEPRRPLEQKVGDGIYHCRQTQYSGGLCAYAGRPPGPGEESYPHTGIDISIFLHGFNELGPCGCLEATILEEAAHNLFGPGHGGPGEKIVQRCFPCGG